MRYDFLFVFDNIVRDLPSVALISFQLQAKGFISKVIHLTELNQFLKKNTAKVLILNKPFLHPYSLLLKQIMGMKVCVLHTEGAMGARYLEKTKPKIDLYFFWNDADKRLYQKRNAWDKLSHPVVGCQRTDFLFDPLFIEEGLNMENNMNTPDQGSLTVSIASPGGYAGLSDEYIAFKEKQINSLSYEKIDFRKFMEIEHEVAELAFETINEIVNSKLDLKLLFKPHPNENFAVWESKFKDLGQAHNVQIIKDKSIAAVLKSVDVHICAGHCQTLSEAVMMGVYAMGFNPEKANSLYDATWMSIGAPHARSSSAIIEQLKVLLDAKRQGTLKQLVNLQYEKNKSSVDHFFAFRDGKVYERCLYHLIKLHERPENTNRLVGFSKSYIKSSLVLMLRRWVSGILGKLKLKKGKITRHERNRGYELELERLYEVYRNIYLKDSKRSSVI